MLVLSNATERTLTVLKIGRYNFKISNRINNFLSGGIMSKRLTIFLIVLLGIVLVLAQTTRSEIKLIATKVEMNGQVKLTWTKARTGNNTTQYNLYRALYPDTVGIIVSTSSDTSFVDQVPPTMSPLNQYYGYKVVAKTGTTLELSNVVFVSVPGLPPIGSFHLDGKIDSGKVKLSWQVPPINTPIEYYLVFGMMLGSLDMVKIDSTKNLVSVTDVPPVPPGAKQMFNYFVRAKVQGGDFLQSTSVQLTVENKIPRDEVKFVSVPNMNGQKNIPYLYTAKAVSSDPTAVIRYSPYTMMNSLFAYKIDSVTGVVDWTPSAKGIYPFALLAKSNKGGYSVQTFSVAVAGGNGIIQGKVTDTLNAGIANTIIEIYKTENSTLLSFAYSVRTDPNGNYRINRVDPGNYKLRANAPSTKFQSQWYDGKREVSLADVVAVIDSPAVSLANFKLRGGVSIAPKVHISGSVTDTVGIAINGADSRVIFVRVEFALNFGSGMNAALENFRKYFEYNLLSDFRLEGNSEYVVKAKVDSLGKYKVELSPGGYIAFARAKGYAAEFFKGQTNFLSADVIRAEKDSAGVNFTLSPLPPVVLGEIKGAVVDSGKNVFVPSRVIAMRDGWRIQDLQRIGKAYITDTDSLLGTYKFSELLPGTYVVMALPLGNYPPAFYSTDTANIRWKRATKIVINGNSVDNINIYVRPLGPTNSGFTGIYGNVNVTGGNTAANGSSKSGAAVYAYRNGEIAGYALTNFEGTYAIGGLAPGQYSVFVDKAGYNESNTVNVNASYDINGNPLPGITNFTIDGTLGVTEKISTVLPSSYVLEQNFPNPFNPSTSIRFSVPIAGKVALKVYNLIGQEVTSLVNGYKDAGEYTVTFNASTLSSGVYFYRLESGSFNVVKKMLLIK
jgi:hypothetical protein